MRPKRRIAGVDRFSHANILQGKKIGLKRAEAGPPSDPAFRPGERGCVPGQGLWAEWWTGQGVPGVGAGGRQALGCLGHTPMQLTGCYVKERSTALGERNRQGARELERERCEQECKRESAAVY